MDIDKLKEMLSHLPNKTKYTFEEIHNKPLSPEKLNKQTYFEIFNSQKDSMKKPINFINYSNNNYDVINNEQVANNF